MSEFVQFDSVTKLYQGYVVTASGSGFDEAGAAICGRKLLSPGGRKVGRERR
jgi:hypothetical protein